MRRPQGLVTSPSLPSDSRIILNLDNMLMPCGNWVAVDLTHTGLVNLTAIHLREAMTMYKFKSWIKVKFKTRMISGSRRLRMLGGSIELKLRGKAGYRGKRLELTRGRRQGQRWRCL